MESADERTPENFPEGSRRSEELVHNKKVSIDGVANQLYENTPDEFDHSFVAIRKRDEELLHIEERRSSSSSSSSDSEIESVEQSKEFNPVIDQEDVSCVVEHEPLEGALPSNPDDPTTARTTAEVRLTIRLPARVFYERIVNEVKPRCLIILDCLKIFNFMPFKAKNQE